MITAKHQLTTDVAHPKVHTYIHIHEDIYIALLQEMYHSALQRTRKTQLIIEQMSFECAFKRS